MTALSTTIDLVAARDRAQQDIEAHLAPYLAKYKELLLELAPYPDYTAKQDLEAELSFIEIDNETFYFRGEEDYKYGEYYTPSLDLPFAFVENPALYAYAERAAVALRKERAAAKTATDKKDQIARLEIQLDKARAELAKAEADGTDEIKITATRNDVANLRDRV